ncbi:MAG TPA: hypothetical protein VN688_00680 [Gemmataceae bacterium]|nr:hypothetical protein [Gemmataceae bacterium]
MIHPSRTFERPVRQFAWQFVPCLSHVLYQLPYPFLRLARDVNHVVVIRLKKLPPVIRDEKQVVVHAPSECQESVQYGNQGVFLVTPKPYRP